MSLKEDKIHLSPMLIRPAAGWVPLNLAELWEYRELLYFLTWRDIKVRYKQTVLGAAWAVIQPLGMMLVFTIFFGRLVGVPSDGLPYPIFAYTALLPWQLFSRALTDASTSLVVNERLITKVYFPRLLIPVSAVLASLVDFAIAFVLLLGMMVFYGIVPTGSVLMLPLFVLLALMTALGIGFWLSALNAQYRDVRYTLPFLTQFWLFATPVVYPSSLVPEQWRLLYGLNPMTGVVEGFRWALLGRTGAPDAMLAVSAIAVLATFIGGLYYFSRVEETLADVV
ncbi:MAG: ABC transporter permease [Deltaproteobacteria bacterium]|nr:ABC transporter permease [Deltaproteobacteria bacterium]